MSALMNGKPELLEKAKKRYYEKQTISTLEPKENEVNEY